MEMTNNAMSKKKEATGKKLFTTKQIVTIGLLSALSYVLMLLHFPFKYLGFLELELSDVPAILGGLVYGPLTGVLIELIKNIIKGLTATTTGGVGELANFIVSVAYVIPVTIIFRKSKLKQKTVIAFAAGTIAMVIAGCLINYYVTVPLYAKLFGGMDAVIGAAAATIPAIKGIGGVVLLGITPFNIIKAIIMSVTGYYTYKIFKTVL